MTLAQNLLQLLSGSKKKFISLFVLCLLLNTSFAKDKAYKIALILPFNFHQLDVETATSQDAFKNSNLAIDYYRGFKLALDSLSNNGYTIECRVFDTKSDTLEIRKIAIDPYMLSVDMVFTTISPNEINHLLKANVTLKTKIISAISPAIAKEWKAKDVVLANNTLEDHARSMARNLVKLRPGNFLVVRSGLLAESRYAKPFMQQVDSLDKKIIHKEIITAKDGFKAMIPHLSKTKENILLIPSGDQAYAIKLFKYLEELKDEYKFQLFVHPVWIDYQTIDPSLFIKYNVHISTSYFVDYADVATIDYLNKYKAVYYSEPTELSFRAFDQGMFFIKDYFTKESSFLKTTHFYRGISSTFTYSTRFESTRNKSIFVLRFTEEGLINSNDSSK
jgi:hypothetical protein